MRHEIRRVRHELRRRRLQVQAIEYVTPKMVRIHVGGDDLDAFTSLSPDDHVKIFLPTPDGGAEMRDYTPRRYDAEAGSLALDFALHDSGPATDWASKAKPGDILEIGGPRGSAVVPTDFDWWLLIGDETALPAIGRRIEELPAGTPVISIGAVTGPEEEQQFETLASHQAIWVHRPAAQAHDPAPVLAALQGFALPPGEGFIWIAAEAGVARALRAHVVDTLGHPPRWLKAGGYWVKGQADASEKISEPGDDGMAGRGRGGGPRFGRA